MNGQLNSHISKGTRSNITKYGLLFFVIITIFCLANLNLLKHKLIHRFGITSVTDGSSGEELAASYAESDLSKYWASVNNNDFIHQTFYHKFNLQLDRFVTFAKTLYHIHTIKARYPNVIYGNESVNAMRNSWGRELNRAERAVVPYAFKSQQNIQPNEATLSIHGTTKHINQLPNILRLWSGPVSFALMIDKGELRFLPAFLSEIGYLSERMDLHLLIDNSTVYPSNLMMHLAMRYVKTGIIVIGDLFIQPSLASHEFIKALLPIHRNMVYLIPCWSLGKNAGEATLTKDMLTLSMLTAIDGHDAEKFAKWLTADIPYLISKSEIDFSRAHFVLNKTLMTNLKEDLKSSKEMTFYGNQILHYRNSVKILPNIFFINIAG